MAFTDNNNGVPSLQEPLPDDDLSLILRHLLRRPPPSSSPAPATLFLPPAISGDDQLFACPSSSSAPSRSAIAVFSASDRLSAGRVADENENSLNGVVLSSSTPMNNPTYFPVSGGSSDSLTGSVQMTGFEHDDYDGESEEAAERTAAEEAETKQPPPRIQSKRSRAAEVHNLSEKRRRSRINEKMKALQNLIPNSNKTDKASMLDEAIEYLKQLQLQVQMLSIRNGLSLHPMCLPGVAGIVHPTQISQVGMDLGGHRLGKSRDVNTRSAINMTSNTADTMFNLPKQSALPATASVSTAIDSQAPSFGLGSSILPDFGSFELRDQSLHEDHFFANNTETRTPVTRVPLLPENQESNVTRYNPSKGLTSR